MLGLNSTNGSGEGGRLAVAQAAALSRVEDTGGESLQNLLLPVQSTDYPKVRLSSLLHIICTPPCIRISVYHNKLGLPKLMSLCTRARSKSLNHSRHLRTDIRL